MKPTGSFNSKQPLTAHGIIRDLIAFGLDRGSLVRPAKDGQPAGVVVFLLTPRAIREVGPWLRDVCAQHTPPGHDHIIQADGDSHLGQLLEVMTQSHTPWLYTPLEFESAAAAVAPPPPGLMLALVGPHVNDELAAGLTQRGVTANLK